MSEQGAVPELAFANAADEAVLLVDGAPVERFQASGQGEDLRIDGNGIAGGALEVGGTVVHPSAFRV